MESIAAILNKVVFWSLLVVIPVAVFPYGTVDPWWEALFECSIFAITALWIFESLFSGRWYFERLSVSLPMIAITVYAFLQAAYWPMRATPGSLQQSLSVDHYQTYLTARKALALTLFLTALLAHLSTAKRFRWCVRALIVVGLGTAVFGIFRQFLQPPESTRGFVLPFLFYGVGYGQFLSSNAFAYVVEMAVGLVGGLILGGGLRRNRTMIYLAFAALIWTALVLSNSRGGMLSFGCQAVLLSFISVSWYLDRTVGSGRFPWMKFLQKSRLAGVLVVILVLGTVVSGVFWMGGENLTNKFAGPAESAQLRSDDSTRKEIWSASWKLFKSRPWTGAGFGAYYLAIPQFQLGSGRDKLAQAHNDYLDLAASAGLVGLALGAWFIIVVAYYARRSIAVRRSYQRSATLGAVTGIIGVGIHSFVDFGLQVSGIAVFFAALISIAVCNVPGDLDSLTQSSRRKRNSLT